ncbi:putative repeat protein (TIGR01451 family)/fimbrial isopeptide formation D2 family protein, partial [Pseudogracilibacillus auburnensis]
MNYRKLVTSRMKARIQKSMVFLAMFLILLNGILPSASTFSVEASEKSEIEEINDPEVSKTIDGEKTKEMHKGEDYKYDVNVLFPKDLSGYSTISILDKLDDRLKVIDTIILIDGEEEIESEENEVKSEENSDKVLKAKVDGQTVSFELELTEEKLEELAGKELTLQITAQVKEDTDTGEEIENIAEIMINDNSSIETNPAVVTLVEEIKEESESDTKEESESEEESKSVNDNAKAKEPDSESSTEKTNAKRNASAANNETGFNFNTTDTYLSVTSYNGKPGTWLLQIDGHNPSAGIKYEKQLIGSLTGSLDSIALSKDGTEVYAIEANNNTFIYKITEDGNATKQPLNMPSELATFLPLGAGAIDPITGHYALFVRDATNKQSRIILIDPNTGNVVDSSINPNNRLNLRDNVFDDKGNMYYIDATNEEWVRYDRDTGKETVFGRVGNIPLTTPGHGAGLSYLPSNELLIAFTQGDLFASDPKDNIAKNLVKIPNINFLTDAASAVFPSFYTELNIEKFANGSKETSSVNNNDVIEYKLVVNNTGNLPADNVILTDKIPAGTEYVANSTKLNGKDVADIDGQSPLVKGLKIKSPSENASEGVILVDEENAATITFQVKVKDDTAPGSEIVNQATMTSSESDEIKSNEVINTIEEPIDPPNACAAPMALINGDFELPEGPGTYDNSVAGGGYYYADTVPGWKTTDFNRTPRGIIQIMDPARPSTIPINAPNKDNLTSRFAELNADQNSMLYQELPTVPGQTIYWRLDHRGYNGIDTMSVNIGPITDDPFNTTPEIKRISTGTTWKTYTGVYTVPEGQTMTRFGFKAISSASGNVAFGNYLDNIFLGTEPCVAAEKSVSPEGDVFAGDELTYEITVKNSGGDIAANTIIEDAIPEGTEYVPGSMKILNGPKAGDLTDVEDNDAGHYADGKVTFKLGDLPNTTTLPDGITVQFKVKALSSHAGKTVENKAQIKFKDLLKDEDKEIETNEVTTEVIERPDPPDVCAAPVALINGSFEDPPFSPDDSRLTKQIGWFDAPQAAVPGWKTTDRSGLFEIMNKSLGDEIPPGHPYEALKVTPAHGQQFAELNSREAAQLYQDVDTTPGQTIYWRLAHKGRVGQDTMALKIDSATVDPKNLKTIETMTSGKDAWKYYSGSYVVPAGQTKTRFGFEAISSANGSNAAGNFLDDIFLGTEPCVTAEKSVSPEGDVFAGDELIYEVTVKNSGGDIAANTVIEDAIPEGTEYVPGSMKILNGPKAGDLTDVEDNDAGHFNGEKVIFKLGDLPNTTTLPDGITVQFKVKALFNHAGKDVDNKAQVKYKDLLKNEEKEIETNETKTPIKVKDPVLESEKSVELEEKLAENTDEDNPEVGDTLRYTIKTRNTIENSLIENLIISDTIPEGLEYVEGSLEVDGVSVTDVEDDDNGHVVDGNISGQFGDIKDTDWHTLEFLVTVKAGQAGADIKNVATVDGDNIDEPDKPEEEVKIYPRDPVLESEKSAKNLETGKDKFEVGDTIVYTIKTRNKVSDGIVKDLTISDELPDGLEYIADSLEVDGESVTDAEDNDNGHFVDGKVTAQFGDIIDTDWHTLTFQAKVKSGQSEKTIKNVATVDGGNIDEPDKPEEEVTVDPKDPDLESEKSAKLEEKLAGNTDADNPEVGDTLLYTIKTRNTVEDSIVKNLVISDEIPEGLEYVDGSLEVDGQSVTDVEDDDKGHVVDGKISGQFGDIKDTDWHTLEFLVIVKEGQAGADIKNVATVDGDNIDEPDKPEEEVKIYPRDPVLESEKSAKNLETGKDKFEVGDTIVYTIKTRNKVSDGIVEGLTISDELPKGLEYVTGSLEVDGESVTDAEDNDTGHFVDRKANAQFGDITDTDWHTLTFHAKVLSGQSEKTIKNVAIVDGGNIDEPDKPEEEVTVDPKDPDLESEKSAKLEGKLAGNTDADNPEVGDTLRYTIKTRNTVEDSLVENLIISDTIPEGLEYVEGSLEIDGESVTDVEDDDKGHVVDGKISGQFGDIKDTDWHTLEFLVTVKAGQAGADIKNVATVDGDNIDEPDKPEEEVKIYPRDPVLESKKSSELEEKLAGNTDEDNPEVGDTLRYTIKTRNKVEDSLLENLVISDNIPEGLEYVKGSLEVDGDSVTDTEDNDKGHVVDGKILGQFGGIKDNDWHTLEFLVTVKAGQAGADIKNIATVDGDNIDEPDKPEEEVKIYPRDPVLESEKSSKLEEKLAGNTDKDNPEVGDTIRYTIKTRNTVEDSIVKSLVISDEIPEGLDYVEGSLEVDGESVTDAEDDDKGHVVDGKISGQFGDIKDTDWHTLEFLVTVKEGQAGADIKNVATVDGDNIDEPDKPEEEVEIYPRDPVLESEKSAKNLETGKDKFEVGDTIVYTIKTRNQVSDSLASNLVITDKLPAGLEFVKDSIEVSHEGTAEFKDGTVTASFGDVTDTEWRTVTFYAKVKSGQSEKTIKNVATVDSSNIDEPDKPEEEVTIDPKDPDLESGKSSKLEEKLAGNTDKDNPEVGDTIRYTIKTRNTVEDSIVKSLVISDEIPEGLE